MNKTDLLIWLSKMLYGVIYREHLLTFDRSNPLKGRLVRRNFLKRFEMFHLFMQGARIPMVFSGGFPASIFIFETQEMPDHRTNFDFSDNPVLMTIAIRMGKVGVIAALQDGGAQENIFPSYMKKHSTFPLHPFQFEELATKVVYKALLQKEAPKYLITDSAKECLVVQLPLGGCSGQPIYREWNQETYAKALAIRTGVSIKDIFEPPDKVWTWLEDSTGKSLFMDVRLRENQVGMRDDIADRVKRAYRNLR